ncbi:MAG: hypothetical protein QM278_00210 [Pseudomonadota bacterium]|nr:hypothetical protein [Pseudomonadota bacterium]
MNGSNWRIQEQCPQCGAPVVLEETDRILSCAYCRTRLFICSPDPCHYYIPAPTAAETVYVPYWRLRGLAYRIEPLEIGDAYIDLNRRALSLSGLPVSLGVRPQAMKLRFLSQETPGTFLQPGLTAEEALPRTITPSGGAGRDIFIGEAVSLIYSPMTARGNTLYDAFRPAQTLPWTEAERERCPALAPTARTRVRFLPTLCPSCGWDLQGARDTLALTCGNCQSVWTPSGAALERTPFLVMNGLGDDTHYLPFWRLRIHCEGIALESLADLARLTNLPRAITGEMERRPAYLWVPAFKINPALFMRWTRQATVFQPEADYGEKLPRQNIYPVTLTAPEALESVPLTLANIVTDKRVFFAALPRLKPHARETTLVYQPFSASPRELIHQTMKVVIDRKALSFGASM